jgi:hypothetical protein
MASSSSRKTRQVIDWQKTICHAIKDIFVRPEELAAMAKP